MKKRVRRAFLPLPTRIFGMENALGAAFIQFDKALKEHYIWTLSVKCHIEEKH